MADVPYHDFFFSSNKTVSLFKRQLLNERLIISGDLLFALYPLPDTYCMEHDEIKITTRPLACVMNHLCSSEHTDRWQLLGDGSEEMHEFELIHVCGLCWKIPHGDMKNHLQIHHNSGLFADGCFPVDMNQIQDRGSTLCDLINVSKLSESL